MDIPKDFTRHDRTSPLTAPWEPIYSAREIGKVRLGLVIREVHTNSRGLLHGGVVAALADNAMGLSLLAILDKQGRTPQRGVLTTSLSVDYFGRGQLGEWLEIDTVFVHAGKRHGVTQAYVQASSLVIARANAAFAIG